MALTLTAAWRRQQGQPYVEKQDDKTVTEWMRQQVHPLASTEARRA